jgi:hypothetical protein
MAQRFLTGVFASASFGFAVGIAVGLAGLPTPASAQSQLYRCGNVYQKDPCSDGKGKAVQVNANTVAGTKPALAAPAPMTPAGKVDCVAIEAQIAERNKVKPGRGGDQRLADLHGQREAGGCDSAATVK